MSPRGLARLALGAGLGFDQNPPCTPCLGFIGHRIVGT